MGNSLFIFVYQRDEDPFGVKDELCEMCDTVKVEVGSGVEDVEPETNYNGIRFSPLASSSIAYWGQKI